MTWSVDIEAGGWIVDSSSSNCDGLASLHRESALADIGARDSKNIKAVSSRVIALLSFTLLMSILAARLRSEVT